LYFWWIFCISLYTITWSVPHLAMILDARCTQCKWGKTVGWVCISFGLVHILRNTFRGGEGCFKILWQFMTRG
jgi:hypothetical protein